MEILKIENLSVSFTGIFGQKFAVNDISFKLNQGECLCVVGESGSGKSVMTRAIMKILEDNASVDSGKIYLGSENILEMSESKMRNIRGRRVVLVCQNPINALNPSYTIYKQMREMFRIHKDRGKNYKSEIISMLEKVRIPFPESILSKYPYELSGGMLQRIVLAMACSQNPDVLIADEPTSALDVSTQAQILQLLKNLAKEMGCAILLITHDMGVVAEMADRVLVMYCGKKMEERNAADFFKNPYHPYTQGLLSARPQNFNGRFNEIKGSIHENDTKPSGCVFYERCPYAEEECIENIPDEIPLSKGGTVSCFYIEKRVTHA